MLDNLDNLFQQIFQSCNRHDKNWIIRKRIIDTKFILTFLLKVVSDTNYSGLRSILSRLYPIDNVTYLNIPKVKSQSSICVARKKIGWGIFRRINGLIVKFFDKNENGNQYLWNGHRIFAVDGTYINLPEEAKKIKYKSTNKNSRHPLAMMTTLYRLKANIAYDYEVSRHRNEISNAVRHLSKIKKNDIVLYDRHYLSYKLLAAHQTNNIHALFRCKEATTLKEVVLFNRSEKTDTVVLIKKNNLEIKLRLIKYKIKKKLYILATTLLDSKKYSITMLKNLYHQRWGIEEFYKILKQSIQIEQFHSKNIIGVKQEIGVFLFLPI